MNQVEIKDFLKNLHNDIVQNISYPKLQELIKKETYFAGGCFKSLVLNEKVNDFDIYFKNEEAVKKFQKLYSTMTDDGFEVKLVTKNAITFEFQEKIVQFIIKFWGMPYQVIRLFDFRHCQNFYNPTDEYIEMQEEIIKDKILFYNRKSILPISSMKRINKFISQGWIISDLELIKIAVSISQHKLNDRKVLQEQVAGLNFSQFTKDGEMTDSEFEEIFDNERVIRKITKKLKGNSVNEELIPF